MLGALRRFAERVTERSEARPLPPPSIPIVIGEADDADELERGEIGAAEGQYFMIEYRDGRGRISTRRVTVWGIKEGRGAVPLLHCTCHERRAHRSFRADRILSCIDLDGEVHDDVPAFLAETFGMSPATAARTEPKAAPSSVWHRARPVIRHHATLLAALSLSDATMRDEEIVVAVEHCSRVADAAELPLDEDGIGKLERYIRRQRPTREAIWDACEELRRGDAATTRRLLASAVALVDADGVRHDDEIDLLNDIAMELTGVPLVQ